MDNDSLLKSFERARVRVGPASKAFLEWLERVGAPVELIEHFKRCSIRGRFAEVEVMTLYGAAEIKKVAEQEPAYLRQGFLPIGYAPNGDPIVLELRRKPGAVGYVSHDEYWEHMDEVTPRQCYVRASPSLHDFVADALEGDVPIDYYEARDGRDVP